MNYQVYIPSTEDEEIFVNYFENQASQTGFGFIGTPYQRGAGLGSIFGSIFRAISPFARSALKSVGKAAASTGLQVASDAIQGRNIKESLSEHSRSAAANLLDRANSAIQRRSQAGSGLGIRPKVKTHSKKYRSQPYRKTIKDHRKQDILDI